MRPYQFANARFNPTPYAVGPTFGGSGSPGGILSLSANGTSGAVQATVPATGPTIYYRLKL